MRINANEQKIIYRNVNSKYLVTKTKELKTKEPKDIASLMGLSDKLSTLNFDRYFLLVFQ